MEFGNLLQIDAFLYACGLGFWIGLYYEMFRTLRLLLPPSVCACFVQDLLFCLSSAVLTFFGFLAIADGNMYPYLFVGETVGFLAFYYTVGRVLHIVLASVIRRCIGVVAVIGRVMTGFCRRIKIVFARLYEPLLSKLQKIRKKIQLFSKKT